MTTSDRPLAGRRVIVGRERPGELADLLEEAGAEVVHVPLIATRDPEDERSIRELSRALDELHRYDWLAVTSVAGAERVGAAAAASPSVGLAAVGSASAARLAELTGRDVDLVPETQRAAALGDLMVHSLTGHARVLVAVADRAGDDLERALSTAGHDVTRVVAYRTVLTPPNPADVPSADALVLTSGSTAESWSRSVGAAQTPSLVVAIGPATATVAERCGVDVTVTADDQSVNGLVSAVVEAVRSSAG